MQLCKWLASHRQSTSYGARFSDYWTICTACRFSLEPRPETHMFAACTDETRMRLSLADRANHQTRCAGPVVMGGEDAPRCVRQIAPKEYKACSVDLYIRCRIRLRGVSGGWPYMAAVSVTLLRPWHRRCSHALRAIEFSLHEAAGVDEFTGLRIFAGDLMTLLANAAIVGFSPVGLHSVIPAIDSAPLSLLPRPRDCW